MSPPIEKVETVKAAERSQWQDQTPIFVKIAMIPVSSALSRPNVIARVSATTMLQRQPTIPIRRRTDF